MPARFARFGTVLFRHYAAAAAAAAEDADALPSSQPLQNQWRGTQWLMLFN